VEAARRVGEALAAARDGLSGDFVALVGNVGALAEGRRFLARDMNRAWTGERLAALDAGAFTGASPEDAEQAAVHGEVMAAVREARGEVVLVDLHSTSGEGAPFSLVADTPRCAELAALVPVTALGGLIGRLSGTMTGAFAGRIPGSLVIEAGQHASPATVDRAEAALWCLLAGLGCVAEGDVPRLAEMRALLAASRGGLPASMEVVYRHGIRPEDEFRMRDGFRHFDRVSKGDLLATDSGGAVLAPSDGYVVMPLYQGEGEDGFFLAR
jgi:succinylglutamate desuccinylase